MSAIMPTIEDAEKLNLSSAEFDLIKEILGRLPNELELEIFSLMWSEHASYKSSWNRVSQLPSHGGHVITKIGKDSAGAIDLGNGLACVLKVESHNSPCAIQPRLGAATGLRVVTRDLISMGAKPVAFLNSLRMGAEKSDTSRWLFTEVINGLSEFEKGYEVPVVAGDTFFSRGYNNSPVVNNMAVGIVPKDKLVSGACKGIGNVIVVMGALTGKHGVDTNVFETVLTEEIEAKHLDIDQLMDVSVEKKLQQAIQVIVEKDVPLGIQAVGAQGIIGAVSEMVARGESGAVIEIEKVPVEEEVLDPRDILFSQTWGRLLFCIEPNKLMQLQAIAKDFGLSAAKIGEVTDSGYVECFAGDKKIAEVPAVYMGMGGKAPVQDPEFQMCSDDNPKIVLSQFDEPDHYPKVVKTLIDNINVASKDWLSGKFVSNAEEDKVKFPSDAAFVDLDGTGQSLVLTMDCNTGYMKSDPYVGVQIAVAEASRNIVCAGGKPLAISDCLNFGSPQDKFVYDTFVKSVDGLSKASQEFGIPIVSGNVSFYNQRSEEGSLKPIIPTPIIGMVGLVVDKKKHSTLSFRHKGDMIYLIGRSRNDVNSSEYAYSVLGVKRSVAPYFDVEEEKEVQQVVSKLIEKGLLRSVHDVSTGGLFFTLLECAIPMEFGFDITSDAEIRKDAFLFGESQSRIVVSVAPEFEDDFVDLMIEEQVPFSALGHVTRGEIRVDDEPYGFVADLKERYNQTLINWIGNK